MLRHSLFTKAAYLSPVPADGCRLSGSFTMAVMLAAYWPSAATFHTGAGYFVDFFSLRQLLLQISNSGSHMMMSVFICLIFYGMDTGTTNSVVPGIQIFTTLYTRRSPSMVMLMK